MKTDKLILGVPKGRVMNDTRRLFNRCGIDLSISRKDERAIFADTSRVDLTLCPVRSSDIPLLLEEGVLDIAVLGGDVIAEAANLSFGSKRDLDICKCRLSVIGLPGAFVSRTYIRRPRVATKYPRIAREYFERQGCAPDIVKMYGSVELALLAGMAHFVVDIVDTGATIARNNLRELEVIQKTGAIALISHRTTGARRQRCHDLLSHILDAPHSLRRSAPAMSEEAIL
eukprot:jgi/Tetstr1/433733/TSEL_022952.t1